MYRFGIASGVASGIVPLPIVGGIRRLRLGITSRRLYRCLRVIERKKWTDGLFLSGISPSHCPALEPEADVE